jgi:hypothetical protein
MKQQFLLLFFLVPFSCHSQTERQALPASDYPVFAAVINRFSNCIDMEQAHLRDGLVFVRYETAGLDLNNLGLQFRNLSKQLKPDDDGRIAPKASRFYTDSTWTSFLDTVDSTQFDTVAVDASRIKPLACRKAEQWTASLDETYFSSTSTRKGLYELRQDYHAFVSLVAFSKVAYSADSTKAFCYFSEVKGPLTGEGLLVFLEKQGGYWRVVALKSLWQS